VKGRVFFDTNVLVYADDIDAGTKRDRAQAVLREAIASGEAVLSTQVLQEYFVVVTRKLGVPPEVAQRKIELLARLDVVVVRPDMILSAIDLCRLRHVSFWDALVVKCAASSGCTRLLTEDLGHGQIIDGVRVENPFA